VVTVGGQTSIGVVFTVVPGIGLSPTSGAIGTSVTITGTNFGPVWSQYSTVTFNGVSATSITSWSDTSIVATVPAGATTGNVVVNQGGQVSNGEAFAVLAINSLSPTSGAIGTSVTLTGTNFGSAQGASTVMFNGVSAAVTSWSNTSIVALVPAAATTGNVVVTVGGQTSNGVTFTVVPTIGSLSPTSGAIGTSVTITGTNFGSSDIQYINGVLYQSTVTFNGVPATSITSWSNTSIVVTVPARATTGNVVVTVGGQASNGAAFTVLAPTIGSLSPTSGAIGTSVTITGTNFGPVWSQYSTVTFNGVSATSITSWSDTSIVATVPAGATTGNVVVTVGGQASNGAAFTVLAPTIGSLSPTSGVSDTSVTIAKTNSGPTRSTSTVKFKGAAWNAIWSTAPLNAAPNELSSDGGSKLRATLPINASGHASYSIAGLSAKPQTIAAAYANGTDYAAGSASVTINPVL
jgi:hypothetical protein